MIKKIYSLVSVCCISIILSGCWDAIDIQERDMLTLVITGFKGNKYCFYTEVAPTKNINLKNGSPNSAKFSYLYAEGNSLYETRDDLNRKADQQIYLGATRAMVFTDGLAKKGVEEYVNRIRGVRDYRKSVDLFITTTDPRRLISSSVENDLSLGYSFEDTIKHLVDEGNAINTTVGDVLNAMSIHGVAYLIPSMNLRSANLTLDGYSVMNNNKEVYKIPFAKSKGVVYLLSKKPEFYYRINNKNLNITTNFIRTSKSINVDYKNNKCTIDVKLDFKAKMIFMDKFTHVNSSYKESFAEECKKVIKNEICQTIQQSQKELGCDYLGFYKDFRAKYPREFSSLHWDETYRDAKINVHIGKVEFDTDFNNIDKN